jgi:hypothetical protein
MAKRNSGKSEEAHSLIAPTSAKTQHNVMKNYRSSIPSEAKERITARHIRSRRKYKAEYILDKKLVGVRFFDEAGKLAAENPLRDGLLHGVMYYFHSSSQVCFAEPYVHGLAHGIARQWDENGKRIGAYTMSHGTGVDLWRQRANYGRGRIYLQEARYLKDGKWHGFEWWLNEDQESVHSERHFQYNQMHGIEREWNVEGHLRRGYPRYWVSNKQVTRSQYLRARAKDPTLPPFREKDNRPQRSFPPEIAVRRP